MALKRKKGLGAHGTVKQVAVSTSTAESAGSAHRRLRKGSFARRRQRRMTRKGLVIGAIAILVAIVAAVVVGLVVFFASSNSKLALSASDAADALVEPEEEQVSYALCAATLGTATAERAPESDAYLLVRIDAAARQLTFVAIPSNVTVWLQSGDAAPLYQVRADSGDAELVRQVAELAGVGISHFASTDASGLRGLVDAVGGVPLEVAQEVDDPRAGIIVLEAGEQVLDGDAALVFLRATNFTDGFAQASANRVGFSVALATQALSAPGLDFAAFVGNLGSYASTDYTADALMALADAFRPMDSATIYQAAMDGHTSANTGLFVYDDDAWEALMGAVRSGASPASADAEAAVNTSAVTVEVRNGTNATGMGQLLADSLSAEGYQVGEAVNAGDGIVYPETLIVYRDPAFEGAAKAISTEMSGGRVINGGDYYSFNADVLVIIGADWMPVQ